jgi:SAM-dependent methyltransferase
MEYRLSDTRSSGNVEQARAWNGADGEHWTEYEDHYNATVEHYHLRLMEAAQPSPADLVLDVGCGCGESTRDAARIASSGRVLGVDLSAQMIARARERARAERVTNVEFERADAQAYPFRPGSFDLAISRFGAMFFAHPVVAFVNIGRALRPGGRIVLMTWQELARNEWLQAIRGALAVNRTLQQPPRDAPGAFGLADPAVVRKILTEAGFEDVRLADVNEPVRLGRDTNDAFDFVSGLGVTRGLLEGLDQTDQARALEELRAMLDAHATETGVLLASRAWLITANLARLYEDQTRGGPRQEVAQ